MKMLEVYFAFSWGGVGVRRDFLYLYISNASSFQPFSAPAFLRGTAQSHQKPCLFTVIFRVRGISYQETNWNLFPAPGVSDMSFEAIYLPSHT